MADRLNGRLKTQVKTTGPGSSRRCSETVITDDHWHRVGLTWDGADRVVYVDDVEVVRDTPSALKGSVGSMNIGVGSGFEAGTFWSGMVDDVRIYDRVVIP